MHASLSKDIAGLFKAKAGKAKQSKAVTTKGQTSATLRPVLVQLDWGPKVRSAVMALRKGYPRGPCRG